MRVRLTVSKEYDVQSLMPEIQNYAEGFPITFSMIEEFIVDRFVNPNFDENAVVHTEVL